MDSQSDLTFVQVALENHFVSKDQVKECQAVSAEMMRDGDPMSVKELLFQRCLLKAAHPIRIEKAIHSLKDKRQRRRKPEFGDYTLLAHLGRGGMAHVYLARRGDDPELLAIKILHPDLVARSDAVERLLRETAAIFKLDHPNIVRGREFGNYDGQFYLTMEYVEGQTLKSYAKQKGPLPEDEALSYAEQVASALEAAHKAGFIHRDIKPRNLLLQEDSSIKVLDFGLSKSTVDDSQELTQEGHLLGTVLYAAPEQLRGETHLDCRADIYSLGITLYDLLMGKVPFRGPTSTSTAALHLEQPFPDPKQVRPDLSDEVCLLIKRMTRKSTEARYQNPTQLLEDIHLIQKEGRISPEEPGDLSKEPMLPGEQKPHLLLPGTAAGLALAAGLMFLIYLGMSSFTPDDPAETLGPNSPVNLMIPSPQRPGATEVPETITTPKQQFALLKKNVANALEKGDFRHAYSLLIDLPESLKVEPWHSNARVMREKIIREAIAEIDKRRSVWLKKDSASLDEKIPELEELENRVPKQLVSALDELKTKVHQLHDSSPHVAIDPSDTNGQQPKEAPTHLPTGATTEVITVPVPIPTRPLDPKEAKPADGLPAVKASEARQMFIAAQKESADGNWEESRKTLQALIKKHGGKLDPDLKIDVLELSARAKAATARPESFFSGRVVRLEKNELEIFYNFADPKHLGDWISYTDTWEVGPLGIHRRESAQRDVLWWRHPHLANFHIKYETKGYSHLSCVVAGDGLTSDEGHGVLCGLGHYGALGAVMRWSPDSRHVLAKQLHAEINSHHFYIIEVSQTKKYLSLQSKGVKMRGLLRKKSDWKKPRAGNGLRLGLVGWQGADNVYRNARIRARLPDGWLDQERASIRAGFRFRNGLLMKNHALKTDGKRAYGIVPGKQALKLKAPFTLELWFSPDRKAADLKGNVIAFGIEKDAPQVAIRKTASSFQIAFILGRTREVISLNLKKGWHHLAFQYDGKNATLYMDGKRLKDEILIENYEPSIRPLLGGFGSSGPFKGQIDEVRLSNTIRYEGIFEPDRFFQPDRDTILLLKFDEGEGNTAFDSSGKEHNAFLYGTRYSPLDEEGQ